MTLKHEKTRRGETDEPFEMVASSENDNAE